MTDTETVTEAECTYDLRILVGMMSLNLDEAFEDLRKQYGSSSSLESIIDRIGKASEILEDVETALYDLHAPIVLRGTLYQFFIGELHQRCC